MFLPLIDRRVQLTGLSFWALGKLISFVQSTGLRRKECIMDQIVQIIGTVGFPIVAAGALFWYMTTEQRELRNVIDNNSNILLRILEHLKEEGK